MAKPLVGIIVSDLHVGSIFGLLPPSFRQTSGITVEQNPGQVYLWQCWLHLAKQVRAAKPDFLVVNGDVVDGTQRAQHGTELALGTPGDQQQAATAVLKAFIPARTKTYFIQGTEYHDAKAGEAVDAVAATFGASRDAGTGTGTGYFSYEVLDLAVGDAVLNISHGISVATGFYRTTPLDREGIWSALAGKEGGLPRADLVIRSHGHTYVHVEHASKHVVMTPCWQLQTRFMRKNSVYRMLPDIGGLFVYIDPAAKRERRDPIRLEKVLYPLPPIKLAKIVA